MRFGINTLDDFDVRGKTVLCRVDINQPLDRKTGTLKSVSRIRACAPTVRELADKGARVVLLAHQGSDIEYKNYYTTRPHAEVLSGLLGRPVGFIDDVCGPAAREAIAKLNDGEILLLDNVRHMAEEQTLFEKSLRLTREEQSNTLVVRTLSPLADLYVCDAFAAAHRDQPTLCGFEQVLPSAMGRLFEREYCALSELTRSPKRPCAFVLGGAKVADAFLIMESVLNSRTADVILTGGLVGNILLAARGEHIGKGSEDFIRSSGYWELIDVARKLLERFGNAIRLPIDIACVKDEERVEYGVGSIPEDACATDIGGCTAAEYARIIMDSATVFVNGPMGVFEREASELGSRAVWDALGDTQAYTVIGGGDSLTATEKFAKTDAISYLCTGGGALIQFLTGKELPVVAALRYAADKFNAK